MTAIHAQWTSQVSHSSAPGAWQEAPITPLEATKCRRAPAPMHEMVLPTMTFERNQSKASLFEDL